jgi:glycosyltransferase involved in cell wall biosynthesis
LLDEVLRTARAVIVSSQEARAIVTPCAPAGVPVHVLPLAVPTPPVAATVRDGTDDPWVVSLGVVSTVKRIDDVLRSFAAVRAATRARLAVVGNVDPLYARELLELASELGVRDDVVMTGLVPADEYAAWVRRATVIVQLRSRSVGEGSATVTDALAAGRAVVTNVGSTNELPTGVVERVDAAVTVDDLADRLARLLRDEAYRDALERGARDYATTHTFADVARRVLEIAATTEEPSFPAPLAVA